MANTRAEAFAPATVANLGVGFDILGLAVEGIGDTISAEWHDNAIGAVILSIEGDKGRLPTAADKNVATIAANALLQDLGIERGIGLHLKKGLPLSSGLGSSAASSVAAVVAVNALLGYPYEHRQLLPFSLEGEAAVSGYHADNAAPCLFGGITLSNGIELDQIRQLPVPKNLHIALVTPDVEVPTSEARAVLPAEVPIKSMIRHTGAVAALIDALYRDDVPAMADAMEFDLVIEPARKHLMPYLEDVRTAAKQAGALALVISGAGPTLIAICDNPVIAEQVTYAMKTVYDNAQISCEIRATTVLNQGANVTSLT
ncbi:MAG: homoserine kinase [Phototrophicaceae bacterium]